MSRDYIDINESTKVLFNKAINILNNRLKKYAKNKDANKEYVKNQDQLIQDLFNFYSEAETVIHNLNFNRNIENVFYIKNENRQDCNNAELRALKRQNEKLKTILRNMGVDLAELNYYTNEDLREMQRINSIAQAKRDFNF